MSSSIFCICANHRVARRRSGIGTSPLTSGSDLRALNEYVCGRYDGFDNENERTPSDGDQSGAETPFMRSSCKTFKDKPANFGRFINIHDRQGLNAVPSPAVEACRSKP